MSHAAVEETDCRFCDALSGRVSSQPRAFDDGRFAVLMGRYQPTGPGYTLVVPYTHVPDLDSLPDAECGPTLQLVRRTSAAVRVAFAVSGTTVLLNSGPPGQSVPHLHFHVIPRWHGDGYPQRTDRSETDAELERQAAILGSLLGTR